MTIPPPAAMAVLVTGSMCPLQSRHHIEIATAASHASYVTKSYRKYRRTRHEARYNLSTGALVDFGILGSTSTALQVYSQDKTNSRLPWVNQQAHSPRPD